MKYNAIGAFEAKLNYKNNFLYFYIIFMRLKTIWKYAELIISSKYNRIHKRDYRYLDKWKMSKVEKEHKHKTNPLDFVLLTCIYGLYMLTCFLNWRRLKVEPLEMVYG